MVYRKCFYGICNAAWLIVLTLVLSASLCIAGVANDDGEWLEDNGVKFDFSYIGEYFTNMSGGVAQSDEGEYVSLLNLGFTLDANEAFGIEGGSFGFNFKAYQGIGVNPDYIGAYQNNSNVAAGEEQEITHVWYRQEFNDGLFWFKVGKQNGDAFFANPKLGGPFIHSSAHFSPTVPSVAYPETHWGIVAGSNISTGFKFAVGAFNVPGNTEEENIGQRFFGEASIDLPFSQELAGQFRVGGWISSVERISLETGEVGDEHSGFYLIWDQSLLHSCDIDGCNGCDQGIGFFLQYGQAPQEHYVADSYYGAGILWTGPFQARKNDQIGLGYYNMTISEFTHPINQNESALELFYNISLTGNINLLPDVQYIINPGGLDVDPALAVGLRLVIVMN